MSDTAAAEELIVERRGAIAWITFNRPQARNALTWRAVSAPSTPCSARRVTCDAITRHGSCCCSAGVP